MLLEVLLFLLVIGIAIGLMYLIDIYMGRPYGFSKKDFRRWIKERLLRHG